MKPPPFVYHAPTTVPEACDLLAEHADDSKVLAGGQSFVPLLNLRLAQADHLIDLNRVADLSYVRADNGTLAIGSMTRQAVVERAPAVRERFPLLMQALQFVGHWQIRNRGTLGGSICHADPAAELPTIWLTAGGEATLSSAAGTRTVSAEDFFLSHFTTDVRSDECVTEIRFNLANGRTGWAFREVARRHGDFALVGIAAQITMDGKNTIQRARIGILGAGPTPLRAHATEHMLEGADATDQIIEAAASASANDLTPVDDVHASAEYRCHVAKVLARRALAEARDRAMTSQ